MALIGASLLMWMWMWIHFANESNRSTNFITRFSFNAVLTVAQCSIVGPFLFFFLYSSRYSLNERNIFRLDVTSTKWIKQNVSKRTHTNTRSSTENKRKEMPNKQKEIHFRKKSLWRAADALKSNLKKIKHERRETSKNEKQQQQHHQPPQQQQQHRID